MTVVEYFSKKYPDSIENGYISIRNLAGLFQMYQYFNDINDFDSMKKLGLTDLMKDVKYIGNDEEFKEYLLFQREQKLKRIINEENMVSKRLLGEYKLGTSI